MIRVRVSDLCQFVSCPKRSKIQGYTEPSFPIDKQKYLRRGTELHRKLKEPYGSFDRRIILYHLYKNRDVFERVSGEMLVRGDFDNLRVLYDYRTKQKVISFIETKTTHKKHLKANEYLIAIFQLQLYIWLLEPYLKNLPYKIHTRHYVEVRSQEDARLLKRIVVYALSDMDKRLSEILETWRGLKPATYPIEWICKGCPKNIKEVCGRV